jgi:hypothetical protein
VAFGSSYIIQMSAEVRGMTSVYESFKDQIPPYKICNNSDCISQGTHYGYITMTIQLMLFWETMAVCCENRGQIATISILKTKTCSNHWALKAKRKLLQCMSKNLFLHV